MQKSKTVLLGITTLVAVSMAAPLSALAKDSQQAHKNNWRNGAIGAGAIAGYGLLKGNKTAAILGGAGAAYSAHRYEQERQHQDQRKRSRARYRHQSGDYIRDGKKYYKYHGTMYYKDLSTGERHKVG
jgi:hypothetical protein